MAQSRFDNYGDFISSPNANEARYAITPKGVYRGFEFSVSISGDLVIAPGYGCQHNGIVWMEDDDRTLAFPVTVPAQNYTIVALHEDQQIIGGAAVEYELQGGLETNDTVPDGVVLGWIYYPGGSVTLDPSHIVQAPSQLSDNTARLATATAPLRFLAPFQIYSDLAAMGANVTVSGLSKTALTTTPRIPPPLFDAAAFLSYQSAAKPAGPLGVETLEQHFQFVATDFRPISFAFYLNSTTGSQIEVQLRDTALNIVTITGSPITGTGGVWDEAVIDVDRNDGVFTAGMPYELRLTHRVDVGHNIKLAWVEARFWPYPS